MKIILIIALVAGMAMCARGIGKIAANNDWLNPIAFVGYILGVAALVVVYAGLTHHKILFVSDEKQALIALVGIIVVKIAASGIYSNLLNKN